VVPAGLGGGLLLLRALLLLISHRAWFMNDSSEYLELVRDLHVPRVRPPGVSVFWQQVLAVWNSLHAVLLAQAFLGALCGLVLYFVARELGVRSRTAVVVAVVGSATPSALFFERALLAESLSVFLVVVATWLALVGLRTRAAAPWMLAGLVGGIGALVRAAALPPLLVTALLAVLLTRGSALVRVKVTAAFIVALAVPLAGYASATYIDTRAVSGSGHFGLQFTDGFAYFAATAPLTDCTDPEEPPAIRARICAIPGFLDRDPDTISWGPGPVSRALHGPRWVERNADLKSIAIENVRRDPIGFLGLTGGRAVRLLSTRDNGYFTDGAPVSTQLFALGLAVPEPAGGIEDAWPVVMDAWAIVRWVLWGALLAGIVVAPRRWRCGGREVVFLAVPALVTMVWLSLAITAMARYLFPFEWIGVVVLGWLAQVAIDRWRATRSTATDRADAMVSP